MPPSDALIAVRIKLADFYLGRGGPGDIDRAKAAYEAALYTAKQIFEENKGSAEAQRDLAASQSKLGDFYLRRNAPGDAELALKAFEAGQKTAIMSAADHWFNAQPIFVEETSEARSHIAGPRKEVRDVSDRVERLMFYSRRETEDDSEFMPPLPLRPTSNTAPSVTDRALAAFQKSLETRQKLAEENTDSIEARRNLSIAQQQLGDFYSRRGSEGDIDRALAANEAALETAAKLAEDIPDSFLAQRDLSVLQSRIGDLYLRRGTPDDFERACLLYEAVLRNASRSSENTPDNAIAKRDLAIAQDKSGSVYLRRGAPGDSDRALAAFEASLETRRKLVANNPDSAETRRDLLFSLAKLGQLKKQTGEKDAAQAHLSEALSIVETFATEGHTMDANMRALRTQLHKDFGLQTAQGDIATVKRKSRGVRTWLRKVFGLPPPDGDN
jgi:tetratricopeptide (TPR) repeat protein